MFLLTNDLVAKYIEAADCYYDCNMDPAAVVCVLEAGKIIDAYKLYDNTPVLWYRYTYANARRLDYERKYQAATSEYYEILKLVNFLF